MAKKYIITADDVEDNLTSTLQDVPLSANQGRVLKGLVDGKASSSHNHSASNITSGTLDAARLPAATASALGGIKVGTGLSVSSGTVSVSYGSASGTACQGNDSRLSDSRTPKAHNHAASEITSGTLSADRIPSITKSKISDFPTSMTPTSHASTATTYGVSSASNYGHAKASSATPSALNSIASVGTDNGLYARGDHVHRNPISISTLDPTSATGLNGDVWLKYIP